MPSSQQSKAWHAARNKHIRRDEHLEAFLAEVIPADRRAEFDILLDQLILSRDALMKATSDYPDAA